jgi:hypothetical protein
MMLKSLGIVVVVTGVGLLAWNHRLDESAYVDLGFVAVGLLALAANVFVPVMRRRRTLKDVMRFLVH